MAQFDICEVITSRIIEQLQQGIIPWNKPWTGIQGGAISGATGRPYSLLNQKQDFASVGKVDTSIFKNAKGEIQSFTVSVIF